MRIMAEYIYKLKMILKTDLKKTTAGPSHSRRGEVGEGGLQSLLEILLAIIAVNCQ